MKTLNVCSCCRTSFYMTTYIHISTRSTIKSSNTSETACFHCKSLTAANELYCISRHYHLSDFDLSEAALMLESSVFPYFQYSTVLLKQIQMEPFCTSQCVSNGIFMHHCSKLCPLCSLLLTLPADFPLPSF